jgi:hypothetical protein
LNIRQFSSFFAETTQQLEGKLKEKVERRLVEKINFSAEQVTPMLKTLFSSSLKLLRNKL